MISLEILAFILYFVLVLGIGIFFFFKSKGNGDKEYFLGGRQMGPYVTAMSAQASDMSGWMLMGLPGSIIAFGFGKAWIGIGLTIGTILNWIFVAKRLRRFSKAANDSITLPQYLSNRFAAKKPVLQIICAIVFLVFFTVYVASGFKAGAKVFTQIIPSLDPGNAMLIFAVIIIVYTFLGGFRAVCWTDFFQGIMMLLAVLTVPIAILFTQNLDFSELSNIILNNEGQQCLFTTTPFAASWQDIVSGLAWGLGYFGMPHILVRFMSIKNSKLIKKSATVAIIWVVLSLLSVCVLAFLGRIWIGNEIIPTGEQELVFIKLVQKLFPPFVIGILLSAIIAAAMSTADSQLLVASSSFTSDIYKPVFRKKASGKEVMWVGRIVVLIIAVIAYFIASSNSKAASGIMDLVENAWAGFGSAFGGVIILSLFWKRITYKGAIAGVLAGAATDISWLIFLKDSTGIYELLPGFIAGLLFAVIISLIDKKPSDEILKIYETATDKSIDD